MIDVDDYVTGHENDTEEFDLDEFRKSFYAWKDSIVEDLDRFKYDMNLLCIREVLSDVSKMIMDNTITKTTDFIYGFTPGEEVKVKYNVPGVYIGREKGIVTGRYKTDTIELDFGSYCEFIPFKNVHSL